MATMEERIPHIRTICEKFLAEGQDAALKYACVTHERDYVPGKGSSVEGATLLSTCSALMEPCYATELVNEVFDWVGVDNKEPRQVRVFVEGNMQYVICSPDGNDLSVYAIHIEDVPDAILRWTALAPGVGAKGIRDADHESYRNERRIAPIAKSKLEKIEGLTEAMERLRSATKTAQVWQVRVEEMLTKAGIVDDRRLKPKSAPSENASDGQTDGAKVIAPEDLSGSALESTRLG